MLNANYKSVLDYIENYWPKITFSVKHNTLFRIAVPFPFVAPNHTFFRLDLFYWDSYFIILGLVASSRMALARDIVENLIYLFRKFGMVPQRNRWINISRTNPPFLSQMAYAVYAKDGDREWLHKVIAVAKEEYRKVWGGKERFVREIGLNRYSSFPPSHILAEHESGWDMTSRFRGQCRNVIPVDLNCLLYKYETDFADEAKISGSAAEEKFWRGEADKRRYLVNKFLWDEKEGFFFDYNFVEKRKIPFKTLAAYYALWSGIASQEQSLALVQSLSVFETSSGLTNTEKSLSFRKQWDWPNGWPNQIWIAVKGLLDYGYESEAKRIAQKWLDLNVRVFKETGALWEKYDVVSGDIGKSGLYPTQPGFGWTNAVFLKLLELFPDLGEN